MPSSPSSSFRSFFESTTSGRTPFGYQRRLAEGENGPISCGSRLIDVPTGCGKTAAVVLAWLWNHVFHSDESHRATWPRRLVYCLPMRTLVEQTASETKKWLGEYLWDGKSEHRGRVGLHILMGGEDGGDWDIYPEADAILIGTQDMLLSHALRVRLESGFRRVAAA